MNITDRLALILQVVSAVGCLVATAFGYWRPATVFGVFFALLMLLDIRMMLLALVHETIRMQGKDQSIDAMESEWVTQEFQP